jgi:hypothetical protein
MKFKEFLKNEYPDSYEAFDMVLSDFMKNLIFKAIEEYTTLMRITNGTGILPKKDE